MEIWLYLAAAVLLASALGIIGWYLINLVTSLLNLIIGQIKTIVFYNRNKKLAENINYLDKFNSSLGD